MSTGWFDGEREYALYRSTSGKIDVIRHFHDDPPTYTALGEQWERQGAPVRAFSWKQAEQALRTREEQAPST